jgi:hypothetical protein
MSVLLGKVTHYRNPAKEVCLAHFDSRLRTISQFEGHDAPPKPLIG